MLVDKNTDATINGICEDGTPSSWPVCVLEAKKETLEEAAIQARLYAINAWYYNTRFRPIIGLAFTRLEAKIELYVPFQLPDRLHPVLGHIHICKADVSSMTYLLVVLKALIISLLQHREEVISPFCAPPFHERSLWASRNGLQILGARTFRVDKTVYKLYDKQCVPKASTVVDFLTKYSGLQNTILHVLVPSTVSVIACSFEQQSENVCVGHFVDAHTKLQAIHDSGLVHGDIRKSNMIFTATTTVLLDFDLCQKHGALYPYNFNSNVDGVRHPDAKAGMEMNAIHDLWALGSIMEAYSHPTNNTSWQEVCHAMKLGQVHCWLGFDQKTRLA